MSLKTYGRVTLNGNWYEERQPSLSGVLPNMKVKTTYETTSKSSYTAPPPETFKLQRGLRKKKAEMEKSTAFDSTRESKLVDNTSYTSAFGPRETKSWGQRQTEQGLALAPPAGGQPAVASATSFFDKPAGRGLIGENLQTGSDPKANTKAQRSWIHSAPELHAMLKAQESFRAVESGGDSAIPVPEKPLNNRQITFGLTATNYDLKRIKHVSVFQDQRPF